MTAGVRVCCAVSSNSISTQPWRSARSGGAPLAFVVAEPIFDDFGDVFAALVAHRSLRSREPTLEEFSQLEGAGLAVLAGEQSISVAGIPRTRCGCRRARFLPAAQQ
jgi:hypothetical protein